MKDNIIIVGDYNRSDFLYVARIMHPYYNINFLEYTYKGELLSDQYKEFGKAVFWGDYKNALELLEQVKPKFVIFYFIESYNHVALNVSCKYKGVKTFHMEHGIRNYEMLSENIAHIDTKSDSGVFSFIRKLKDLKSRIKGRLFFKHTVSILPATFGQFLKQYHKTRSVNSVFNTFRLINSDLRIADSYISFSSKVFEFHHKSDHLPKDYPVHFIGVPSFDYLAQNHISYSGENDILFIDNAFETQLVFGWNEGNKIQFLLNLVAFAEKQDRKLWIKAHPYSVEGVYTPIRNNKNVFFIEREDDLLRSINDSNVIIGFYSTLLMPLMAMHHTVCFALEMHPEYLENKPSMFLVETGAIYRINSWVELEEAFQNLDAIYCEQKKHKNSFIDQWMYKFDGKSSERLKSILLSEAS